MTNHASYLEILARTEPGILKTEAEDVLPHLGEISVVENRSGLVMLPMRDTAQGTDFHLGEVLVSEAHIKLERKGTEGYGMIIGCDLERAMAMAVIDAALEAGIEVERLNRFVNKAAKSQQVSDNDKLRRIEATRVNMETF